LTFIINNDNIFEAKSRQKNKNIFKGGSTMWWPDITKDQRDALFSYLELFCGYLREKKSDSPVDQNIDMKWFVNNRQRICCLPSVTGVEEKFVVWFKLMENGYEKSWIQFLGDLSDLEGSYYVYRDLKNLSPFADKLIVIRHGRYKGGTVILSENEGIPLKKDIHNASDARTLLVFDISNRKVFLP
jgi:hypothetical protein